MDGIYGCEAKYVLGVSHKTITNLHIVSMTANIEYFSNLIFVMMRVLFFFSHKRHAQGD